MISSLARSFRSKAKQDFHKILGVHASATETEIKHAYFKLAKELHPDVNRSKNAHVQFSAISEAYEALSSRLNSNSQHKSSRQDNKQQRANKRKQETWFNEDLGFNRKQFRNFQDLFNEFEEVFSGNHTKKPTFKGKNIHKTIKLSFKEAALGSHQTISINRKTVCKTCKGNRARPGTKPGSCLNCGGRGEILFQSGAAVFQVDCQKCKGSGSTIKDPCSACKGTGAVFKEEDENIKFPPGITSGQIIKLTGRGHYAEMGGSLGDLMIRTVVQPHPDFRRDGQDIISDVSLSISQAVLGSTLRIQTLYGATDLEVSEGTQNDTRVRLKEHGVPHMKPQLNKPGDHVAVLHIKTPRNLTTPLRELYYQLAAEEGVHVTDR